MDVTLNHYVPTIKDMINAGEEDQCALIKCSIKLNIANTNRATNSWRNYFVIPLNTISIFNDTSVCNKHRYNSFMATVK